MASRFSSESLARYSAVRPKRVASIWLVTLVLGFLVIGTLCESSITNADSFLRVLPDSEIAENLLIERLWSPADGTKKPESVSEILVIRSSGLTVDDQTFRDKVESIYVAINTAGAGSTDKDPTLVGTVNYYITGDPTMVSDDRQSTIGFIEFAGELDDVIDNLPTIQEIVDEANGIDGFEMYLVGDASFGIQLNEIAEKDLLTGEGIGIFAALIILVLVFRALGAAPIPILLAIVTIIMAVTATSLLGQIQPVSFFIINMIMTIGMAVGIDYSLFIVGRYREERRNGLEKVDAIARAGATASRSVFFSGVTVVVALVGMLAVPASIYYSLGLGAILAAVMAVVAAMTLLPAILSLAGDKVDAIRIPLLRDTGSDPESGFWHRVTRQVMAHPVMGLVLSAGLLILLAIPALGLKTGLAGVESFSDEHDVIRGYGILVEDFSSGIVDTTDIVIDTPSIAASDVQAGIQRLQDILATDDRFNLAKLVVNDSGNLGLLKLSVNSASSDEGFKAVRDLRNDFIPDASIPASVYVGGSAASNVDFINLGDEWLPYVVIFVLTASFILLTVVFRSLVVPIKAIIMNLLSVSATYGLLTMVFIHGIGVDFLGFTKVDAIDSWIPLFLFSVLFGLSMDYHVILLSRIRERFDETGNNDESVAFGLQSTAGMITGAATIMVAVFLGFALAEMAMFQQMGFGLAVAVFLDATVVRSVLVPASMRLLGTRNWYLPGFLEWLPDLRVEGDETPRVPVVTPRGATD
ncbi:MAG: MMPL family transporter [Chloroflexi bacterium]|nr:MMPL family transporter [Chloroflexota bacterium]